MGLKTSILRMGRGGSVLDPTLIWGAVVLSGTYTITAPILLKPTSSCNVSAGDLTVSGIIHGGETGTAFSKLGAGTLILTGANIFVGIMSCGGGTLQIEEIFDGGIASPIGSSPAVESNLYLASTLSYVGNGHTTNRSFRIGATNAVISSSGNGPLVFSSTGFCGFSGSNTARTFTLSGTNTGNNILSVRIGDNGTGATSIVKSGVGKWYLSGANTYTGSTTCSGGKLVLSGTNSGAGTLVVSSGGNLQPANTTANNGGFSSGILYLSGGTLQSASAAAVELSNTVILNATSIVAGGISITLKGSLTNTAGTRTITNNMVAGTTLTLAGTVYLSESNTVGRSMGLSGNGETIITGNILDYNGTGVPCGLNLGGGIITLSGNNTFSGPLVIGACVANLNGTFSGTSATATMQLNSGANAILNGTMSRSAGITVASLTASFTESATGVITDGSLVLNAGTVTLNGNNTYSGVSDINAGTVTVGHNNAFGSGNVVLSNTDIVTLSSGVDGIVLSNDFATGPSSTAIGGSKSLTFAGTFSFYFNPSPGLNVLNSALTTFAGPVVLSTTTSGNATTQLAGTGDITISGDISDGPRTGGMGLRHSGTGLLLLSGTNSYIGLTTVSAGTLRLVGAASLSSGTTGLTFNGTAPILQLYGDTGQTFDTSKPISFASYNPAATIDLLGAGSNQTHTIGNVAANPAIAASSFVITGSNGYGLTMGNLTFTGGNSTTRNLINNAEGLWTIGAISDDVGGFACTLAFSGTGNIRVAGAITDSTPGVGPFSITKSGTNSLTLDGVNTHDGTTTISGGTLQGMGSVSTNTTVANNAGATIRGGAGAGNAGTFTITGSLTFAGANALLAVGIGSTTTCSLVAVSGAVALGGMTVNFDASALDAGTYTLITGGSMSGTVVQGTAPTGRTWTSLSISGNNLVAVLA